MKKLLFYNFDSSWKISNDVQNRVGSLWVENSILVMKMNTRTPPQWYDSLLKRSPASHVLLLLLLLLQRSGAQAATGDLPPSQTTLLKKQKFTWRCTNVHKSHLRLFFCFLFFHVSKKNALYQTITEQQCFAKQTMVWKCKLYLHYYVENVRHSKLYLNLRLPSLMIFDHLLPLNTKLPKFLSPLSFHNMMTFFLLKCS